MQLDFLLKLCGVFLGVLARSLLPFLRKLRDGEVQAFHRRYLLSAIASFIIGFIIALVIFPQFNASLSGSSFESYFKLFCLAFGFGFGFDALVLETAQWARFFRTAKKGVHHNSSHHGHE